MNHILRIKDLASEPSRTFSNVDANSLPSKAQILRRFQSVLTHSTPQSLTCNAPEPISYIHVIIGTWGGETTWSLSVIILAQRPDGTDKCH
jgi:hypothetical protein